MGVIVMIEPQAEHTPDVEGKSWVVGGLRAVHAARAADDVAGDPADTTLCGLATAGMEKHSYHPSGPGASWYPPNLTPWECKACSRALHES
ncbi:hypothetical protein [Streptacidiphilus fuscans]|uniref:Uncharacterized protein n=1 Tax=Streptacidiphilus fuscans TaxID=2789292 RepID=A0A931FEA6_9ACTN|nr:hypothetical protein [Streptacidiphilus fuscans]MBF9068436.1 hypothetical protein [Streptacidiphilus fuscans]